MSATYEPGEALGTGPAATVFRGRHCNLHYPVAIKQLRPELFNNVKHRERFFREAQHWAAIEHEQLVPIKDLDAEQGWIVMELMPQSLAVPIRQGSTSAVEVGRALEDCLIGLNHVHTQGYLHGNITPTNVFQDGRQRFRLADGRGVSLSALGELSAPSASKYSAPEMFEESFGSLGPTTDLYCLGIVALELLVGPRFEDLFRGLGGGIADRNLAWIQWHGSHSEKAPSPRDVVTDVPTALAITIERLLQKEVANRYSSAREALHDLQSEGGFSGQQAARPSSARSTGGHAAGPRSGTGGSSIGARQSAKGASAEAASVRGPGKSADASAAPHALKILSGPRAGEVVGFDADELLIGTEEGCQLQLAGYDYPHAIKRRILLRREANGWTVHSQGAGGLLVNQQPISDTATLRSGDILRFSFRGPDLQFVIHTANKLSLSDLEARYASRADAARPEAQAQGPNAAPRAAAPKPQGAAAPKPPISPTGAPSAPVHREVSRAHAPSPLAPSAPTSPQRPAAPPPPPFAGSRASAANDFSPAPRAPAPPSAPAAAHVHESNFAATGEGSPSAWQSAATFSNWTDYKRWSKRKKNIVVAVACSIVALIVLILVPSGGGEPTPPAASPTTQAPPPESPSSPPATAEPRSP